MAFCVGCGVAVNLGQKFCFECGTSLQSFSPANPTATIYPSHTASPSASEFATIAGINNLIREQSLIGVFSLILSLFSVSAFIYLASYPAVLPLVFIAIIVGIGFSYTSYEKRQELMKELGTWEI